MSGHFRLRLLKILDLAVMTCPFALAWQSYYRERVYLEPFWDRGNYAVILVYALLYLMAGRVYGAFQVGARGVGDLLFSQGLASLAAYLLIYAVCCLLVRGFPSALPLILGFAAGLPCSFAWCLLADRIFLLSFPPRPTVVVWDEREGTERLIEEYGYGRLFRVTRVCPVREALRDLRALDGAGAVFLCGVRSGERNAILKYCFGRGTEVYAVPRIGDVLMQDAERVHLFHFPLYRVRGGRQTAEYRAVKRLGDILFSALALAAASPVLLAAALAIRREDGGPVLYRQTRLTGDGRPFTIYKLRSMAVDAEEASGPVLSEGEADRRLTRAGRILRRFRIDEIPQFWNVLRGDMSLVGPRPERPEIAAGYEKGLPEFRLRLRVKAGLTGRAQVYGRYSMDAYDKLLLDLEYISRAGIAEDLKIMLATVKVLFQKGSAE